MRKDAVMCRFRSLSMKELKISGTIQEAVSYTHLKQYGIRFKKGKERWLDLSGTWDAQIRKQMEYLPEKTFFNYMASAMFNGMISPVSPYKICAVIYYQGESDVGHPNRYALEFRALVNDWRKSWKEKQLPIRCV